MDDDLLADDGQFKDDGLDDLDVDEEAALLGLSDEEIEVFGNQDLEYVDEDGNPVEIGENNAKFYEVAKPKSGKLSSPPEDDILDLDLDAELESFTEENPELLLRETPVKTSKDRQNKENLISLTSRNDRRRDSRQSPERIVDPPTPEHFASQPVAFNDDAEFDEESEDESVEDHRERFKSERNIITLTPAKKRADIPDTLESVISIEEKAKVEAFLENEQKRRMRFKGRGNMRMKNETRYPPPSQSFGNSERRHQEPQHHHQNAHHQHQEPQRHQQQEFQHQHHHEPQRHHQDVHHQDFQHQHHHEPQRHHQEVHHQDFQHQRQEAPRQHQEFQHQRQEAPRQHQEFQHQRQEAPRQHQEFQHQEPHQFTLPNPVPSYQQPPAPTQSRKILINPHFRGARLPHTVVAEHAPQVTQPAHIPHPPTTYETTQQFPPPAHTHFDHAPPVNAPSVLTVQPPTIAYSPEYRSPPPQQHIQQAPPPIWQPPPEIHPSFGNPPPPIIYDDPGYHSNYSANNYQNMNFNAPQIPPPQPVTYSQPPPVIHTQPPPYIAGPPPPVQPNVNQGHFLPPQPRQPMQQPPQAPKIYNVEQRNVAPSQGQFIPRMNVPQQRFARLPEKRPSNVNSMKQLPMKQPRIEHVVRKNFHVNSSNIKEIPLVDTVLATQKPAQKQKPSVIEEEDEETKELRQKIEEQKLLREQILKRKEERRRQMAAQRMMELQKRQSVQNKDTLQNESVVNVNQMQPKTNAVQNVRKLNVRERIGMPISNTAPPAKKKVIVVRKKQATNNAVPVEPTVVPITQRLGTQPNKQPQQPKVTKKIPIVPPTQNEVNNKPQTQLNAQPKKVVAPQKKTQPLKPAIPPTQKQSDVKNSPVRPPNSTTPKPKPNVLNRLGPRENQQRQFRQPLPARNQRPPLSPRMGGPRTPPFHSPPFMEPRMRFLPPGPPMNEMRMQRPHPFLESRPHLMPFPPRERPHFQPPLFQDPPHPRFRMPGPDFRELGGPGPDFRELGGPGPDFRELGGPGPDFRDLGPGPDFRDIGPGPDFRDFGPMGMDMFPERFPPPHFQNHGPPMRHQMFQRPRLQGGNMRQQKQPFVNKNKGKDSPAEPKVQPTLSIAPKKAVAQVEQQQNLNSIKSQSVSVQNLSSSTSEMQLKKLCSEVGVVEKIELIKKERKALIKFKEQSQALDFQKKYQRYMLDLAMIQVSLVPT